MVQSDAKTVPAYLKTLPPEKRKVMSALRKLIRDLSPLVKESMQYGMPAFSIHGESFCHLNAQKHYYSLYASCEEVSLADRKKLGKVDCGKSCIRFRKAEDLDLAATRRVLAALLEKRTPSKAT